MTDRSEIERRLSFIGLDEQARIALRATAPFLEQHLPAALDAFYEQVRTFPETRRFFADDIQVARARQSQLEHWRLLAEAVFDQTYVDAARRIGETHARIGLDPRWYISGYSMVVEHLVRRAGEQEARGAGPKAAIDAVIKAVTLDMELVVSVYLEAADQAREAAEESAREALAELARAARALTVATFASSIAHEVNQPMTAIVANSQAALRWLGGDTLDVGEVRSALERIIRDADRTTAIVGRTQGMLTKSANHRQAFDINRLVQEALLFSKVQQKQASIRVKAKFSAGLPPVQGDPVQIQQVVVNLVANAMEAMVDAPPPSRVLVISTDRTENEGVVVTVSDTGCGIDAEAIDQIFQHLFTTKSGGMGLGLSVSKAIVEAHGGQIRVGQNQPSGAVFSFSLPRARTV